MGLHKVTKKKDKPIWGYSHDPNRHIPYRAVVCSVDRWELVPIWKNRRMHGLCPKCGNVYKLDKFQREWLKQRKGWMTYD